MMVLSSCVLVRCLCSGIYLITLIKSLHLFYRKIVRIMLVPNVQLSTARFAGIITALDSHIVGIQSGVRKVSIFYVLTKVQYHHTVYSCGKIIRISAAYVHQRVVFDWLCWLYQLIHSVQIKYIILNFWKLEIENGLVSTLKLYSYISRVVFVF